MNKKETHPFIAGLLQTLPTPQTAWPEAQRQHWLDTAESIFGLIYKEGHGDHLRRMDRLPEVTRIITADITATRATASVPVPAIALAWRESDGSPQADRDKDEGLDNGDAASI